MLGPKIEMDKALYRALKSMPRQTATVRPTSSSFT